MITARCLHFIIFTGENYWSVSGRGVTEIDLKNKKKKNSLAFCVNRLHATVEAKKRKGSNCSLECETLIRIGHGGGGGLRS